MKFKNLEEKGKYYRSLTDYKLLPNSYVIVMLDGRAFSRMVKNRFKKPFDEDFMRMMNETARYLCEKVQGCKFAYVQSDEISLLISAFGEEDLFFGGRLCKIQSIVASMATGKFNQLMTAYDLKNTHYKTTQYDNYGNLVTPKNCIEFVENSRLYEFDCKAWNVPNENEAFAWFLWRQLDCIKNSKQQTAQTWCSYKELLNKSADDQVAFLKEKTNISWDDFSNGEKYGRFVVKQMKHFKKYVDNLQKEIEYDRMSWEVVEGNDLSIEENRNQFLENFNQC